MLIYYFLTGLKPLGLDLPLPMTSEQFLLRAQDALSGSVLLDLENLASYQNIVAKIRANYTLSAELWWSYWQKIKNETTSPCLQSIANSAQEIYAVTAWLVSNGETFKNELDFVDGQEFIGLERHPVLPQLRLALNHEDPLVLERSIMVCLFHAIDEAVSPDTFSCDQVFSYFIKLLMCERLFNFDKALGQDILEGFLRTVMEGVSNA